MISEQDKQAILNGAYGVARDGCKAKLVFTSNFEKNNSPYLFVYEETEYELYSSHWLNSKFCDGEEPDSEYDIVGLWQDKPEPFNLGRALTGEPVITRDNCKAYVQAMIEQSEELIYYTLIGYGFNGIHKEFLHWDNKPILDACCGGKMFWFDKSNPLAIFADIRSGHETFTDRGNTRTLEISPDIIHDFTKMPFTDGQFKLVIFDPPHLTHGGDKSWLVKKYGRLEKNWQEQLSKGFSECFRVLDEDGILIFKWNETQVPVCDILTLVEYSPIIGHKSGKRSNTHWIVFMKNELTKKLY